MALPQQTNVVHGKNCARRPFTERVCAVFVKSRVDQTCAQGSSGGGAPPTLRSISVVNYTSFLSNHEVNPNPHLNPKHTKKARARRMMLYPGRRGAFVELRWALTLSVPDKSFGRSVGKVSNMMVCTKTAYFLTMIDTFSGAELRRATLYSRRFWRPW